MKLDLCNLHNSGPNILTKLVGNQGTYNDVNLAILKDGITGLQVITGIGLSASSFAVFACNEVGLYSILMAVILHVGSWFI